ncbi:MAG: UvrB/UvrC motif-containing protein [Pirellulales bacterium]|nr:UvrB/UvrC motif-containing protein [Pirellulales bacterium]
MPKHPDIDAVLADWPYQPGVVSARLIQAADGREVIQLRVELGLLQMETADRPDGQRPGGAATYLALMIQTAAVEGLAFELSEEQSAELDREFIQFYHRRICWLALREFDRAVRDADHTLRLMDFAAAHSSNEDWILSHEQYRPFVLFHRTQAAALSRLTEDGPEAAVEEINLGLERIRELYSKLEAEEEFDGDELAEQLRRLQGWIRENYHVGRTLEEQLADAVATEQYELAARLRDELARRPKGR